MLYGIVVYILTLVGSEKRLQSITFYNNKDT